MDVKFELEESSTVSDSMKVTDWAGERLILSGSKAIQSLSVKLA